uniref:Essential MCU regulator, mitochondrial n=1 Tax=Echinostoma caproni TaxID=27848 RepID=A0A183AX12_9TREM
LHNLPNGSHTSTGALHGRPHLTKFGAAKCAIVMTTCIYAGAMISKSGAAFLEENEIFVPEDDDD